MIGWFNIIETAENSFVHGEKEGRVGREKAAAIPAMMTNAFKKHRKDERFMKKILAITLAAVLLLSLVGTALAEAAAPKYTITDLKYDGQFLSGKVVHDDKTPAVEKIKIRATFFIVGNYYMATSATVKEDGTFIVEAVGPIEYITAIANSVTADGNTWLTGAELFVK